MNLLTWNQAKFVKASKYGFLNAGHHLAPAKLSGRNVCPDASPECRKLCLNESGLGQAFMVNRDGVQTVQRARLNRTALYIENRTIYIDRMKREIQLLANRAGRDGARLCLRLNATSDLPWETLKGFNGLTILEEFKKVQFYDYTKSQKRALQFINGELPKNYFLTFSRDERPKSEAFALAYLSLGGRVALCYRIKKDEKIPKTWHGFKCIDGDTHDLRFKDKKGSVCVLRPKGQNALKAVNSGFVIKPQDWVL